MSQFASQTSPGMSPDGGKSIVTNPPLLEYSLALTWSMAFMLSRRKRKRVNIALLEVFISKVNSDS
eukprot:m.170015 g.170015  ORF g.170015 m.170015 type:complete len:66 (+) comp39024_c0_seq4:1874-2071(+)